ncbi:MAG: glucans biosynthesis glucosyltransferase MdoH [Tabrizicola sp.]|jgi:membrane glycosyltransferase|nr:glucans biosynthesis glucosyltransferase MdoH [Tabrizicola sp.]
MTFPARDLVAAEALPSPLAMPDQDLRARFRDPAAPGLRRKGRVLAMRAAVLLLPMCVTAELSRLSLGWFALDGRLTLAEAALVGITGFVFFWVVLSAVTACLGLFWRPASVLPTGRGLKVVILLPMYGEPAVETVDHAVQLLAGLAAQGTHRFALRVLSDTRAPDAVAREQTAVAAARRRHPGLDIAWRHRTKNNDYKSGNIRDWVQSEGLAFDAMLILDADSIMGRDTVLQMADALAGDPSLGLVQTVPRVLPGRTIWQGLQSFASEIYGTNMGRGFAAWTGNEGNFLGHNAIVRICAFAACAGLPHLPGRAPRGGVILSHDFVEAALLRRAGWGVRMMPEAADSFEDTPETLIGYLRRDRRWCQGNLQHLRLLAVPGLHPLSRFHLLQGAMAYLASVWWLALLILWSVPGQGGGTHDPFAANPLMPSWPVLPAFTQSAIAGFVLLMLVAPKLLGLIAYLRDGRVPLAATPRLAGLVLAEMVLSALLAPALMVHQVRAVLRTAWGLDGGWMPHVTGASDLRTLVRFHAVETGLGAALLALMLAGHLSLWLAPVVIGLCLTVPLAAFVQMPRRRLGLRLLRRKPVT